MCDEISLASYVKYCVPVSFIQLIITNSSP